MKKTDELLNELQVKVNDAKNKVTNEVNQEKTAVTSEIEETKVQLDLAKKNLADWTEDKEDEAFALVAKLKNDIDKKHLEFKAKRAQIKYDTVKLKDEVKLSNSIDDAVFAVELAKVAIDEALLAVLESIEAQIKYDETYNDEV